MPKSRIVMDVDLYVSSLDVCVNCIASLETIVNGGKLVVNEIDR